MNISDITSGPLASPAELIYLQESLTASGPQLPVDSRDARFAFRGQSQSYGTLVPSFQRRGRHVSRPLADVMRGLILPTGGANGSFQFQKRSQLLIRTHNEPLSVAAMRVSNPDRSSFKFET